MTNKSSGTKFVLKRTIRKTLVHEKRKTGFKDLKPYFTNSTFFPHPIFTRSTIDGEDQNVGSTVKMHCVMLKGRINVNQLI